MSKKTYQQQSQFSNSAALRLTVNGKSKTIVFESKRKNGYLNYETDDADVQKSLEDSKLFKEGFIMCINTEKTAPKNVPSTKPSDEDSKKYEEVTKWEVAKEILRSEPYNVPFQKLNNPTNILKQAEELGVSFPNLNVAE